MLAPAQNFVACELDYLAKCPVCGNLVVQITRIDSNKVISSVRYINRKAADVWNKIQSKILYEDRFFDYSKRRGGSFYLNYNEFGVKKRCYSNYSNLRKNLNFTL